jgi:SAM-dependent methyltransferase
VTDHADVRYLAAKRSVDDRALSRRVRDRVLAALPDHPHILEAGCGTGVTVPRLLAWGVTDGCYHGVDRDPGVVAHARHARPAELRYRGYDVTTTADGWRVGDLDCRLTVGDALTAFETDDADLLVAQAFADLVPIDELLTTAADVLAPGGLAYLPITFDGVSIVQPAHPDDDAVLGAYHDAIDATPGRDSRAGRRLLTELQNRPGTVLAAASSDWLVRPVDGAYRADERCFLDRILDFVGETVTVPAGDDWLSTRRAQLATGELTYVAHQYDILYRAAPSA